jgi:hypothetical protein
LLFNGLNLDGLSRSDGGDHIIRFWWTIKKLMASEARSESLTMIHIGRILWVRILKEVHFMLGGFDHVVRYHFYLVFKVEKRN